MSESKLPTHRERVELPVGFLDSSGKLVKDAEVRAVTGGDEFAIGMSPEYNRSPNDLVYKTLLLARCVTKLGERTMVALPEVQKLHVRDVRALEYAIYRITYGKEAVPEEGDSDPGV